MALTEPVGFFGCTMERVLDIRRERNLNGCSNMLASDDAALDFGANRQIRVRVLQECFQFAVLTTDPQQQMFCLDIRASILARFISAEEHSPTRFLCEAFKHACLCCLLLG